MNWYKTAQLHNFEDRNQFNHTISRLKDIVDTLKHAEKLIFQTARGARQIVAQIADNKTLSSFLPARELLRRADRIALDSPSKFAYFCRMASELLKEEIYEMEDTRHRFLEGIEEQPTKGFPDEE